MPRDLQQSTRNEMIIQDALSGCSLVLYYRQPTTAERIAFQRDSWKRKGKKLHNHTPEARAQYGAVVLTGVREGDFSCGKDAAGNPILIASDPGSLNYRSDWKELVIATAGDLLLLLGMQVFEGSFQELLKAAQIQTGAAEEDEAADDGDADPDADADPIVADSGADIVPLAANSNG